jgi:hypothetical protein
MAFYSVRDAKDCVILVVHRTDGAVSAYSLVSSFISLYSWTGPQARSGLQITSQVRSDFQVIDQARSDFVLEHANRIGLYDYRI